jgi:flagellar operon protein
MSDRLPINQLYPNTIRPGQLRPTTQSTQTKSNGQSIGAPLQSTASFRELLQQKILFSQHAETRLKQRGITLQADQIEKINAAIDKAAAKGAKDSLVLMNDLAFIINVKSRTVITAMDNRSLQDHVFTQIDSAVIIP